MTTDSMTVRGLRVNPTDFADLAPFREGEERTGDARLRLRATSALGSASLPGDLIEETPASGNSWKMDSPENDRPEFEDDWDETSEELQNKSMLPFLRFGLETFMKIENAEQMGLKKNQRAPGKRVTRLNGYRRRGLTTPLGRDKCKIPKRRNGEQYVPSCFRKYSRIVPEMTRLVQQAWIGGVSTRTVDRLSGSLESCGISKSEASRICMEIDAKVNKFLSRPLYEGDRECRYLFLDATYVKGRVGKHVRKRAVVVAIGVDRHGRREILGIAVGSSESFKFWRRFLLSLKERGLGDPELAVTDGNSALRRAVRKVLPETDLQLCRVHWMRSVIARIPKDDKKKAGELLRWIFDGKTPEEIRRRWKAAIRELRRRWNCAEIESLTKNRVRNELLMFARYPKGHWKRISATNLVERLNREIKRRSRVVSIFPNDEAILRLVGATMMKIHAKWVRGRRYMCPDRIDAVSVAPSARAAPDIPELLAQAA